MAGADGAPEGSGYAELEALVGELREQISELQVRIADQDAVIAILRGRLAKSSRNSSQPPSSEGYSKPPARKDRSLRKRSGHKPGGQEGHEGVHLERVEEPDRRVVHEPEDPCSGCGRDLTDAEEIEGGESRQVFDIPEELALEVIEHVASLRRCEGCGLLNAGSFPKGVGAPTQYGPSLRALGVYLHVFQHVPYDRARQLVFDMSGARVSTATLKAWVDQAACGLTVFDERLRALLQGSAVVHFDETGARIAGRLQWVHSASTETLTRYSTHHKRGRQAMDDAGVLPGFCGVAVHDGWKPYATYMEAIHALCGAHHLRELLAAEEAGQAWASGMSVLLLDALDAVEQAKAKGTRHMSKRVLAELHRSYRTVIASGYEENPDLATSVDQKIKRPDAQNLLLRLDRQEAEALRFTYDFRVPFTNNLSERDIRMIQLQQKISGSWRTDRGAERYLQVRSYISTAHKQGQRPLAVLRELAAGRAWLPQPAPG